MEDKSEGSSEGLQREGAGGEMPEDPGRDGEFPDRSLQIRIAGVLHIAIGAVSLLLFLLIQLAGSSVPQAGGADYQGAAFLYLMAALFFFWTGYGALMLRRFVRPLILALMWPAFISGTLVFTAMAIFLPQIREMVQKQQNVPPQMMGCALGCTFALFFIVYMLIPGILVALYQGEPVRLTLEKADPVRRWTDACPVPVFALSLWLYITAFGRLAVWKLDFVPLFGIPLTGHTMAAYSAALFATMLLLAWGLYRLKPAAWWGTMAMFLFLSSSSLVTFLRRNALPLNPGAANAEQVQFYERLVHDYAPYFTTFSALAFLAMLAFLLHLRRFFHSGDRK